MFPPPIWADAAWRLWRHRRMSVPEVGRVLALEGFEPGNDAIAGVVHRRAKTEADEFVARRLAAQQAPQAARR